MCMRGLQQPSVGESGDMAALPAMGLICLWLLVTRSTRAVCGAEAKRLFAYKPGQLGSVSLPTIGHRPTGKRSITATLTLAASAPRWLMFPELRLHSLCWLSAKIAMLIFSTATISAATRHL